jgi:hypothetical protein
VFEIKDTLKFFWNLVELGRFSRCREDERKEIKCCPLSFPSESLTNPCEGNSCRVSNDITIRL